MKRIFIKGQPNREEFGKRLSSLRREAGYTLRGFAAQIGISHRMLHFYETKGGNPPIELLPIIAKSLKISTDQLLGVEKTATIKKHNPKSKKSQEK